MISIFYGTVISRDRPVVGTLCCGHTILASNPGHGNFCSVTISEWDFFLKYLDIFLT